MTFKVGDNIYVSLTEANNDSFPDMGLERNDAFLKAVFPASARGWQNTGPITTPWRVAIIAEGLTALVNSDIVTNLCPPPSPETGQGRLDQARPDPLAMVGHRRPQTRRSTRVG